MKKNIVILSFTLFLVSCGNGEVEKIIYVEPKGFGEIYAEVRAKNSSYFLNVRYADSSRPQGEDGVFFTKDDLVLSYSKNYENEYIGAGVDGLWFTKDDEKREFVNGKSKNIIELSGNRTVFVYKHRVVNDNVESFIDSFFVVEEIEEENRTIRNQYSSDDGVTYEDESSLAYAKLIHKSVTTTNINAEYDTITENYSSNSNDELLLYSYVFEYSFPGGNSSETYDAGDDYLRGTSDDSLVGTSYYKKVTDSLHRRILSWKDRIVGNWRIEEYLHDYEHGVFRYSKSTSDSPPTTDYWHVESYYEYYRGCSKFCVSENS